MFEEYTPCDIALVNGGIPTACLVSAKTVPVFIDKKPTSEISHVEYQVLCHGRNAKILTVQVEQKALAVDPTKLSTEVRALAFPQVSFKGFEFKQYSKKDSRTLIEQARAQDIIANYLCAYLTDLPLQEALTSEISVSTNDIREVQTQDDQGHVSKKYYVKGARLHLYPRGFRLYRKSRGVRNPDVVECSEAEAMRAVGAAPLIFEKTIAIYPDASTKPVNIINYRKYDANKIQKDGENSHV